MRWIPRPGRSLHARLALPFALVIGAISLFVSIYFPKAIEDRETAALLARGRGLAEIAAFSARFPIVFEDRADLEASLEGLLSVAEVSEIRVLDEGGGTLVRAHGTARSAADRQASTLRVEVPVRLEGRLIGRVEVHLSQRQLLHEVEAARGAVQGLAAVIFLVGMVSLLLLSRAVTRPLRDIVETAERISEGDLTRRAPVGTTDEVGQLAASFNVMLDRLQSAQRQLRDVNQELERRVEERTARWLEEQTQRLRAEEEKSKVERSYEQILDALPLEVTVLDLDHRYVYLNPASVDRTDRRMRMIGLTATEAGVKQRVGGDVVDRREAAIREATETGCLVSLEENYIDGQGEDRHFLRVYSPMLSTQGEVLKIIGYAVDITSRRRAEEALRESEEKLRQSQKMEAVGRLAGGIAHDFNNLLTVITGHAELLMMELEPESPDHEELDQMKRAAERAATLTRQLLAFSRRQVLRPRHLDPNAVVADVERMLGRLIGEHIDLVTVLTPGIGVVKADPGQLEQVLMNLAVNARDAMPHGGTLTIETTSIGAPEALVRHGDRVDPGEYCMLTVRDDGTGMPEHVLERVFEPFFTTKEVGKGTGLGLATVYGIVKQSGGFVYVDSRVGVGTVFRVYLPQEWPAEETVVARRTEGADAVAGRETVLLVEDEPMVRDLARRILERSGYEVLVAAGGHEALAILRTSARNVDLLFTDVVMPGMPGHELAAKAREVQPDIRVLLMSGYTDGALLERGALEDGIVLLQKPFTPDRVTQVVRRVLDAEPTGSSRRSLAVT